MFSVSPPHKRTRQPAMVIVRQRTDTDTEVKTFFTGMFQAQVHARTGYSQYL